MDLPLACCETGGRTAWMTEGLTRCQAPSVLDRFADDLTAWLTKGLIRCQACPVFGSVDDTPKTRITESLNRC